MTIKREWAVQRGVARFVARAVSVPHQFACYDRALASSPNAHRWEGLRGVVTGWPDSALFWEGGDFHCELKAPGKAPERFGAQLDVLARLRALKHGASWANSVTMYGEEAESWRVPLRENWRILAALEDELVAADIRKQEGRRDGTIKRAKPGAPKVSRIRADKIATMRKEVLF